jgi:hypothetical protein
VSVTLSDLVALVDAELENIVMRGSASVTGDGETAAFLVAPFGSQIVDNATWAVYIDDVASAAYVMDYGTGICTMNSVPTTAQTVKWQFDYVHWPETLVKQAVNAAIENLFPALYVTTAYTITSDGASYEYDMPVGPGNARKTITSSSVANPTVIHADAHGFSSGTVVTISGHTGSTPEIIGDYVVTSTGTDTFTIPVNVTVAGTGGTASRPGTVEFVTGIDSRSSTSDPWKRLNRAKRYEVFHNESTITARFFAAPQSGELRAHCICRPTRLTAETDSIESVSGLPTRAQDAIVSYACYYLLTQKMAPRVRSDVGVTTQGIGALMPSQMNYGAQGYMMRFQFQLASLKMHPWSSS